MASGVPAQALMKDSCTWQNRSHDHTIGASPSDVSDGAPQECLEGDRVNQSGLEL